MISDKKQRLIDYNEMIGKETNHIRNKDEAKLLRQIMSESGLSEAEVMEIPKYRQMLAEAQKQTKDSLSSKYEKAVKRVTKAITKELKLAKEHPLVVQRVREKLNALKSRYSIFWYWYA